MKFIVPHIDGEAPKWTARTKRIEELAKRPLGDVSTKFVEATMGDTEALRAYVKSFVDKRNAVVHHFGEVYGPRIIAEQHDDVLAELRQVHQDAAALRCTLREVLLSIAEAYRDTVFVGTDDYEGFAAICRDLRASGASGRRVVQD